VGRLRRCPPAPALAENTLASVFSGTKGLTSTCVHLLADRGEVDLSAPVARYWPEFAAAGKQDITIASVLATAPA